MGIYDTTFIVNPQTDDDTIDRQVRSVSDLITSNGGKVIHEERLGTRRLAYQIKGLTQGYYTTVIFEGSSQILPVLDRHFKLDESFVRYMTILYEREVKAPTEPDKAEAAKEEPKETAAAETAAAIDDETARVETEVKSERIDKQPPEVVDKKVDFEPGKPAGFEEDEEL